MPARYRKYRLVTENIFKKTFTPGTQNRTRWNVFSLLGSERVFMVSLKKSLLSLVLIVSAGSAFGTPDITPPQLLSFDFAPKSVDVSNAAQVVTVTAHLADDNSGVMSAYALFYSPSGSKQSQEADFSSSNRISGTAQNGIYQTTITIPRGSKSGTWNLVASTVYDAVFNGAYYPNRLPYPVGTPVAFIVTSTTPDTTAPQLVSIDFAPRSVDVSSAFQTVTVTAHLADDNSGVTEARATFYSFSLQTQYADFSSSNRISGTAQDGIYQTTITIPRGSESGTWNLNSVYLFDAVFNFAGYGPDYEFAYPVGTPVDLLVTSSTTDTAAPQLVSIDFAPRSVDVSSASQTVTVTAHLTDDVSGLMDAEAFFWSPSTRQRQYADFSSSNRISGTAQDGIYQATITIPRGSESGTWILEDVYVEDAASSPEFSNSHEALYSSTPSDYTLPYPAGTPVALLVVDDSNGQDFETERLSVQALYGATHSVIRDANLSGGAGTRLKASGTGQSVTYTVPVSDAGTYRVKVGVRTGPKRGIFRLSIDGARQGNAQDEYTSTIGYGVRYLGTVTFLAGGNKAFKFVVGGKNASSSDYSLGLDYIELAPLIGGEAVVTFTLINSDTDQPVPGYEQLSDGAIIDSASLPTAHLNIRANTSPATVGSVRFGFDENANARTESSAPYALFGDTAGDYAPGILSNGIHTLTGTPYTRGSAGGTAGTSRTISFTVR